MQQLFAAQLDRQLERLHSELKEDVYRPQGLSIPLIALSEPHWARSPTSGRAIHPRQFHGIRVSLIQCRSPAAIRPLSHRKTPPW